MLDNATPETKDLPQRDMPGSESREAAENADMKANSLEETPKQPKSILKEPKIGLLPEDEAPTIATTDTSSSPNVPHFNPTVFEGVAATPSKAAAATSSM